MAKSERETRLIENYEDAKIALLMFYLADRKGEEELKEYRELNTQDVSIPLDIDIRCRNTIRNINKNKNTVRPVLSMAGKVLSKVAVLICIVSVGFVALFSSASAFREDVLRFVYDTFDVATVISLNGEDEPGGPSDPGNGVSASAPELNWLPEGYGLKEKIDLGDGDFIKEYKNMDGDEIDFECSLGSTNLYIDTENADYTKDITVKGYPGLYVKKGERLSVVWGDTDNNYIYYIRADSVSEEEMAKIIENIK